jgi:hypothetical protein
MSSTKIKEVETHTLMEEGFDPEYEYNKVNIIEYSNGAIGIFKVGGEDWIYLYPDQVEVLKKFIKEMK